MYLPHPIVPRSYCPEMPMRRPFVVRHLRFDHICILEDNKMNTYTCICIHHLQYLRRKVQSQLYCVTWSAVVTYLNYDRYNYLREMNPGQHPKQMALWTKGGLAVKHPALGANGHRFEPCKRSKLFQGLISRLTTSWVADQVKWRYRLH